MKFIVRLLFTFIIAVLCIGSMAKFAFAAFFSTVAMNWQPAVLNSIWVIALWAILTVCLTYTWKGK